MKITIEKVSDNKIFFSSNFGKAMAEWEGELPIRGSEYFAELEIEDVFVYVNNLFRADKKGCQLSIRKHKTYMSGFLESIEPDGYAILRLDGDIISIEIEQSEPIIGEYVTIITDKLIIYPYEY